MSNLINRYTVLPGKVGFIVRDEVEARRIGQYDFVCDAAKVAHALNKEYTIAVQVFSAKFMRRVKTAQ